MEILGTLKDLKKYALDSTSIKTKLTFINKHPSVLIAYIRSTDSKHLIIKYTDGKVKIIPATALKWALEDVIKNLKT